MFSKRGNQNFSNSNKRFMPGQQNPYAQPQYGQNMYDQVQYQQYPQIPGQPMPSQMPGQPISGQPIPGQPIPGQPIPGQIPVQPVPAQPSPNQSSLYPSIYSDRLQYDIKENRRRINNLTKRVIRLENYLRIRDTSDYSYIEEDQVPSEFSM